MCEAKPGPRCSADTCENRDRTADAYTSTHPNGPQVEPLANASALFGTEPPHVTEGLEALIDEEYGNWRAMRRDARLAGEDEEDVPPPTLDTLQDSLNQMPDDILAEITNDDPVRVRAQVAALAAANSGGTHLDDLPGPAGDDTFEGAQGFRSLPEALGAAIGQQNALHETRLTDLLPADGSPHVIDASEFGDDVLHRVAYVRNSDGTVTATGVVDLHLRGHAAEHGMTSTEARPEVEAFIKDTYDGTLAPNSSFETAHVEYRAVLSPDATVRDGYAAVANSGRVRELYVDRRMTGIGSVGSQFDGYMATRDEQVAEASRGALNGVLLKSGDGDVDLSETHSVDQVDESVRRLVRNDVRAFTLTNREAINRAFNEADERGEPLVNSDIGFHYALAINEDDEAFPNEIFGSAGQQLFESARRAGEIRVYAGGDGRVYA